MSMFRVQFFHIHNKHKTPPQKKSEIREVNSRSEGTVSRLSLEYPACLTLALRILISEIKQIHIHFAVRMFFSDFDTVHEVRFCIMETVRELNDRAFFSTPGKTTNICNVEATY